MKVLKVLALIVAFGSTAVAATPENLTCQVELHDSDLKMILDGSVQLEVLADGFEIAEGPLWIPIMKTLLFSDVMGNKIHQWSEAKGSNVFFSPSGHTGRVPFFEGGVLGSNGLALDAAGNLIICQHGDRRLVKLAFDNTTQEALSTLTATHKGKRFNSPNDLTIAANGDIYFTAHPMGIVISQTASMESRWYLSMIKGRVPIAESIGTKLPRMTYCY